MTLTRRQELYTALALSIYTVFVVYRTMERNAWIRSLGESQDYRNGFVDRQDAEILRALAPRKRHSHGHDHKRSAR